MLAFPSDRNSGKNCLSRLPSIRLFGRCRRTLAILTPSGSAAHPNALPVNTVQSFYSCPSVTLGEKKGIRVIICVVVEAPPPDGRVTVFDHMASEVYTRIAYSVLVGTEVALRREVATRVRASNGGGWIDGNVERTDDNNG